MASKTLNHPSMAIMTGAEDVRAGTNVQILTFICYLTISFTKSTI